MVNMEKVNNVTEKEPIYPILKKMEVGESYSYPCSRMTVVRSIISQVQVATGKVFKTRLERPVLVVTRIK